MLLEKLCAPRGVSGGEKRIREAIEEEIKGYCSMETDALGNLIAVKKGKKTPAHKIMVCAHMDEVGFIVTYIKENGTLKFKNVGGVQAETAVGTQVQVGKKGILGVIGCKPIHLLSKDERENPVKLDQLTIDIGAHSKEEAEKLVSLGDLVTFRGEIKPLGQDLLLGRALDDRGGCAAMVDLIQEDLPYDVTFVFTVQEEIGTRGAKAAAYTVNPDFGIILETTTCADIPSAKEEKKVCLLGKGAVVSYMDNGTLYDRELYQMAFQAAKEKDIPIQTKTMVAGGNDSGAVHVSRGGVRTVAISAPCRYLHSNSCVLKRSDMEACRDLCREMITRLGALD